MWNTSRMVITNLHVVWSSLIKCTHDVSALYDEVSKSALSLSRGRARPYIAGKKFGALTIYKIQRPQVALSPPLFADKMSFFQFGAQPEAVRMVSSGHMLAIGCLEHERWLEVQGEASASYWRQCWRIEGPASWDNGIGGSLMVTWLENSGRRLKDGNNQRLMEIVWNIQFLLQLVWDISGEQHFDWGFKFWRRKYFWSVWYRMSKMWQKYFTCSSCNSPCIQG